MFWKLPQRFLIHFYFVAYTQTTVTSFKTGISQTQLLESPGRALKIPNSPKYSYIVCMYEYETTDPIIIHNSVGPQWEFSGGRLWESIWKAPQKKFLSVWWWEGSTGDWPQGVLYIELCPLPFKFFWKFETGSHHVSFKWTFNSPA